MCVAPCDTCSARLALWDRVAEQVGYVVGVDIGRPEPRGEGVTEVMEVEVRNSGTCDRPLEADHQLSALPSCPLGVEDALVVGRVLPRGFTRRAATDARHLRAALHFGQLQCNQITEAMMALQKELGTVVPFTANLSVK